MFALAAAFCFLLLLLHVHAPFSLLILGLMFLALQVALDGRFTVWPDSWGRGRRNP